MPELQICPTLDSIAFMRAFNLYVSRPTLFRFEWSWPTAVCNGSVSARIIVMNSSRWNSTSCFRLSRVTEVRCKFWTPAKIAANTGLSSDWGMGGDELTAAVFKIHQISEILIPTLVLNLNVPHRIAVSLVWTTCKFSKGLTVATDPAR